MIIKNIQPAQDIRNSQASLLNLLVLTLNEATIVTTYTLFMNALCSHTYTIKISTWLYITERLFQCFFTSICRRLQREACRSKYQAKKALWYLGVKPLLKQLSSIALGFITFEATEYSCGGYSGMRPLIPLHRRNEHGLRSQDGI
jgi:hypothetical protein